jgi:DNA-binding beta-propeller fold protein YncE
MNRKLLRLWVHYRRNAPLIQTLVVVFGIFTLFQNCGRTYGPKAISANPNPVSVSGTPTASATPDPGASPIDPQSGGPLRFPISADSSGNPLFQPGRPFGLSVDSEANVAVAAFQGPLVFCQATSGICSNILPVSRVPADIEVARPSPIGVVILPDSRIVYVDHESKSIHVQTLNPVSRKYEWQATSLGFAPYGIISNAKGTRVYITGEDSFGASCELGNSGSRTTCTISKDLAGFDVAVDQNGNVYVANATSIQVCDENLTRCSSHSLPDGRTMAVGIAVGTGIFVSDYFNARILKCSLENGRLACSDFIRGLKIPRAIRLDQKGNLYVAEYNSGRVIRMSPDGKQF